MSNLELGMQSLAASVCAHLLWIFFWSSLGVFSSLSSSGTWTIPILVFHDKKGCSISFSFINAICFILVGVASMTVPVYIAEVAPPHLRGRLVTINTLFITGGQFFASVVDGLFSYLAKDGWRFVSLHC